MEKRWSIFAIILVGLPLVAMLSSPESEFTKLFQILFHTSFVSASEIWGKDTLSFTCDADICKVKPMIEVCAYSYESNLCSDMRIEYKGKIHYACSVGPTGSRETVCWYGGPTGYYTKRYGPEFELSNGETIKIYASYAWEYGTCGAEGCTLTGGGLWNRYRVGFYILRYKEYLENCNDKDRTYCYDSKTIMIEDWYCEEGYGSDTACKQDHCLKRTKTIKCGTDEVCENGKCVRVQVCGNGECESGETVRSCPKDCPGTCGDGYCNEYYESVSTCMQDCKGYCGDGICNDFYESQENCPEDCGSPIQCGNGVCESGESVNTCPEDCPGICGDGICNSYFESSETCPQDCPIETVCGDGVCSPYESVESCPEDCPGICGDGYCNEFYEDYKNCPEDCPAPPPPPIPWWFWVMISSGAIVTIIIIFYIFRIRRRR